MKKKSIHIIEFLGKKTNWGSWSKKFFLCGKQKRYKKLLVSSGSTSGVDKIPTQDEYKNAMKGDTDLNKRILKLGELNELAYKDLFCSINTSSSFGKVAFGLVKNAKSADFSNGNSKIAWDGLISKHVPQPHLYLSYKVNSTIVSMSQSRKTPMNGFYNEMFLMKISRMKSK